MSSDMKGYRLLELGELIQSGDEYNNFVEGCGWGFVSASIGDKMQSGDVGHFRRATVWKKDIVSSTIDERGKIYGEPQESMTNIGVAWTAILQQHFGITLPNAIPPWVVANMLVAFKLQRTLKGWHEDNYIDAEAYLRFAKEGQKK